RLIGQAASFRALNFFKGPYGDIDLHQAAYHSVHAGEEDDRRLWLRAMPATLDGIKVFAPSAGDRIAMAIAHGGLDAHTHSDWLVDIQSAIDGGEVDWPELIRTLAERRLLVPAAVAFTYLAEEIGSKIPQEFL